MVSGLSIVISSGSAAMATELTEAAATALPAIPRFLKNSRREVMVESFALSGRPDPSP